MTRKEFALPHDHSSLQALHNLERWFVANLENPFMFEVREYKLLPYGKLRAVEFSLYELLTTNPIFEWWKLDVASFNTAVQYNGALRNKLMGLQTIVQKLQEQTLTPQTRDLLLSSLTEITGEIVILAQPHMPRSVHRQITGESMEQQEPIQNETVHKNQPSIWEQLLQFFERYKEARRRKKLPDPPAHDTANTDADTDERLTSYRSSDDANVSSRSNTKLLHPLLESSSKKIGRDRRRNGWNQSSDVVMEFLAGYKNNRYNQAFVMTRLYNRYNPQTGEVATEAPKTKDRPYNQVKSTYDFCVRIPVGKLQADKQAQLYLPLFSFDGNRIRRDEFDPSDYKIHSISFNDKHGNTLIGTDVLHRSIYTDTVGNSVLDLGNLDRNHKNILATHELVLEISYIYWLVFNDSTEKGEFIGKYTSEEKSVLYLYPPVIQKVIKTLLYKKRTVKYRPGTKDDIYAKYKTNENIYTYLAQFLGNYYLTYNELDAPHSVDDPIAYTQTERTLHSQIASCEGCNITLGQLMRFFLDDGEGIAYVTGFVVNNAASKHSVSVTGDSRHLKAVYINAKGKKTLFDATAWSDITHEQFKLTRKKYDAARSEWFSYIQPVKDRLGLTRKTEELFDTAIESSWKAIKTSWADPKDALDSNIKAAFVQHVGSVPQFDGTFTLHEKIITEFQKKPLNDLSTEKPSRTEFVNSTLLSLQGMQPKQSYIPTRNLVKFLKSFREVPHPYSEVWHEPSDAINGIPKSRLRFLEDRLLLPYRAAHTDVSHYLYGQNEYKEAIYNNPHKQPEIFAKMAQVYENGYYASRQNIGVLHILSNHIAAISSLYSDIFKNIFEEQAIKDRLPCDVDTFFKSAPFMLLLPNPLNELEDFFTRSLEEGTVGYLWPVKETEMGHELSSRLTMWKEKMIERLDQCIILLHTVPVTIDKIVPTIDVSSTQLWEQLAHDSSMTHTDYSNQKYLDPIYTFVYLAAMLKNMILKDMEPKKNLNPEVTYKNTAMTGYHDFTSDGVM